MTPTNRVSISGSTREPVAGAHVTGPVDANDKMEVSIILKRRGSHAISHTSVAHAHQYRDREAFGDAHGAHPGDVKVVEKFASAHHLTVVESHAGSRRVRLSGTASDMKAAFGVDLSHYEVPETGLKYRGRTGPVTVPEDIASVTMAVLGLDNRPVAKPHFRYMAGKKPHPKPAPPVSFTALQLAQLYQFPTGLNGSGQTIAIIELGGGYSTPDLNTYFTGLNISPAPNVVAVSVDNGQNSPGGDADGEVMLDIEVAGAIAPAANIAVYFAPNTDQGFVDAISQAVHDTTRTPSVVSISWGGPEDSWTQQARDAMNAALEDAAGMGVTVTVAAGDNGSTDGVTDGLQHVDFPASSPFALACGGTTLVEQNGAPSETVWNEMANKEGSTGGGVSIEFPLPAYQQSAGVPNQVTTGFVGRGVPDVAGDADPVTGYQIIVDGQPQVIGGTSAVAPLWAGLIALFNQQLGKPVGYLNPILYTFPETTFLDVTIGNNGAYSAGQGWDACTGVGSPNGQAILAALQAAANPAPPQSSNQAAAGTTKSPTR
jgi:kumamolisin